MNGVVHFEIPYDDSERAKEFYSKVFGWKIDDSHLPSVEYLMAYSSEVDDKYMPTKKGVINGGMYKRGGNGSKTPVLVIDVENIDEKLKEVLDAGGEKVTEKIKVGEMGYYSQVKDSEGNIVGIWESISKHESKTNEENQKE